MLVIMKKEASKEEVCLVEQTINRLGFCTNTVKNSTRTIISITGNPDQAIVYYLENLPGVAEIIKATKSYILVTKQFHSGKSVIKVGSAEIGGSELAVIAGPCAVESKEQVLKTAAVVAKSGAKFFRGGAFKPRTSPYSFQGLGEDGLKMLAEVRERFGLNIITEAMDERGVDLVIKYADCVQIGARNMQNFSLLKYVGRLNIPVLLKRGMSATLDEFLLAAEYIMSEGNHNIILCERGIRTFSTHARNTLDLSIVPAVQNISHLPIVVDPSHGTGRNYMVAPLAKASVAVGADGLMLEVHPCPEEALCDGAQALTFDQYTKLYEEVLEIRKVSCEKTANLTM
ncbi:MAG: 3-deoxy-7-phosphoheptulonate synthase [Pyrinomonadaceae bacterium]|nr:3-deoxy-7-phosphoheptulonate synthase [Pyrinomonadaceae bacterium]MCX7639696.1 3-deoxy-7-phosphoheptulonate synthase [Pyrinomonadaceae bacterium]